MYISISEEFKSVATINLTPVSIIIITFLCTCIHTLCMQLENAESAEQFSSMLASDEFDFRYQSGLPQPVSKISFNDKQKVVAEMSLHFSVLVSLAELEQLRRGLEIQKFSSLLQLHPNVIRRAFLPPNQHITAEFIQDMYVPVLSPKGSNRREGEEAIVMTWCHYLQRIEGVNYI